MSSIRLSSLVVLCLLYACATPSPPPPATDADGLFGGPVIPGSALWSGQRLNVALRLAEGGYAQVAVDCQGDQAELLYLDGARRVYGGQAQRYAEPLRLSPAKAAALKANPQVAALCARPLQADWREVARNDQGEALLLDRSSFSDGSGQRGFWSGLTLASATHTPRYQAPVAQWRERLTADCTAHRFIVEARYALDDQGRITDGQASDAAALQPFAAATAGQRLLLETACERREALLRAPLAKQAPPIAAPALQEVAAQPLAVLKAMRLTVPGQPPRQLVEEGRSRFRGQEAAYHETLDITPEQAAGLLRVVSKATAQHSESLSWRGLFDLTRHTQLDTPDLRLHEELRTTQLHFVGDWSTLRVGSQLGYRLQQEISNSLKGDERMTMAVNCQVVREGDAQALLTGLKGRARQLDCGVASAQQLRTTWWYLMDYGFFYQSGLQVDADNRLEKRLVRLE